MCSLVLPVAQVVSTSKKGYVELRRCFAGELQSRRSECKTTTRQLDKRHVDVEDLQLKVWLQVDEA